MRNEKLSQILLKRSEWVNSFDFQYLRYVRFGILNSSTIIRSAIIFNLFNWQLRKYGARLPCQSYPQDPQVIFFDREKLVGYSWSIGHNLSLKNIDMQNYYKSLIKTTINNKFGKLAWFCSVSWRDFIRWVGANLFGQMSQNLRTLHFIQRYRCNR